MNFADGQRLLSLIGDPVGFENKIIGPKISMFCFILFSCSIEIFFGIFFQLHTILIGKAIKIFEIFNS